MKEKLEKIPKVELHLHLDGAVPLELASQLSGLSMLDIKEKMIAKDKCQDLNEYLTKFDFPISLMQTKENLTTIAHQLATSLERQNVIYAEIRFAPMFHTKAGLSFEEVVDAVLLGLKQTPSIKTNLILCLMRGMDREANQKTLDVALKYLNKGVCAIDLAGAEDKYPLSDYKDFFCKAREKNLPFTIHAGESGGADEVIEAIQLGATRIGHGIHAIENNDALELIKEKDVLLEVCPTSNVQTNAVSDYASHPIPKLYKNQIPVCINTDDPTISNLSLTEEYLKLFEQFHFEITDYQKMNINALNHAFLNSEEKQSLLQKLN